jgi:asparagine synthase (glutamine-hydrolysing)
VCGIAGLIHLDAKPIDPQTLRRMVARLRHRGPDESGALIEGHVGLGHARLSIIDLSGGRQPMSSEDGRLAITFNGEIFNYVELRRELAAAGHRFATKSDTEVILHAYQQWGDECVGRFNGQWAFAICDYPQRRLFLSRDRLGIRPLYYTTAGREFLFASEVKSLLEHRGVPRRIDPLGLDQVFTFWSPLAPRTVFEDIWELPPAHNLVVEAGRIRTWRYWQMQYDVDDRPRSEDQWAEELLELLTDATRLRLRSDVPVGTYLSGGLDSSVTTALVQQSSGTRLRTFSVGFDDEEFDEGRYQRDVVARLGTDHQSVRCHAQDIGLVFPEVIWHAERPILRTAPAPLFLLSELVRDAGYKVVVTGEGADELLGGYDIFKEAKLRRYWAADPDSVRRPALLARLYPYLPKIQAQPPAYRKAFFHVRPEDLANPLFSHLPRWELTARLKAFFAPEFRARLGAYDAYEDCRALLPEDFGRWHPFCQAQYLETAILMPGYILSSQGDRMAMAHGVEGRFPFLDHRLAELAGRMPPRLKMKGLREKYLLKRAARRLVPETILRRTKQPLRAPEAASFLPPGNARSRHAWVEELLGPARIRRGRVFDPAAVGHLVEKIRRGQAIGIKDNMAMVGVLSTQLFVEQYIEHFAAPQPGPAIAPLDVDTLQRGVGWALPTS